MSSDPREETLQSVHETLSEQFPHVIIAVEAQFVGLTGDPGCQQLLRWYGDSTTATGLITYASDLLTRRFGEPKAPSQPAPPLKAPQEDSLQKSMRMLAEQFSTAVVVVQSEGEFAGNVEQSVKAIRCNGHGTTIAGLADFAAYALRRMAVGA